jgi:hypothetical protein
MAEKINSTLSFSDVFKQQIQEKLLDIGTELIAEETHWLWMLKGRRYSTFNMPYWIRTLVSNYSRNELLYRKFYLNIQVLKKYCPPII